MDKQWERPPRIQEINPLDEALFSRNAETFIAEAIGLPREELVLLGEPQMREKKIGEDEPQVVLPIEALAIAAMSFSLENRRTLG